MHVDLKLVDVFVGLLAHSFATIANFQWFSKLPSPLNGMVEGNHWDQWFSDGFGVRQPLVTMVFDGCAPLVRRWNGYVPSSKSSMYSWIGEGERQWNCIWWARLHNPKDWPAFHRSKSSESRRQQKDIWIEVCPAFGPPAFGPAWILDICLLHSGNGTGSSLMALPSPYSQIRMRDT